ncbi:hypothetical protein FGM00_08655 [Aggregatimonas sangjinii]|uniref:Carboxypeptidase-like regulatory domain-containing protein n=1 Tax=Aggregatimonas sangjinii TaxID=2583587 RepID=A0A5B7ST25_9FLAO|nr:carboxypeptidase-like regulatory domain-containing protein [Aggregatimonas sangjinii]QCX00173.1 hypothetical protein FGM00_08655 [Aggregatimonas sangjinii]
MNAKSSVSIACLFLSTLCGHAQKDYKGVVIDAKTNEIVPYVNIGIVGKGIGTVSDEEGIFHLEINPEKYTEKDTLILSALGYRTIKYAVPDLVFAFNEYPPVAMQPELLELNEVVVTNTGGFPVEKRIGYMSKGSKFFGYWSDNVALGGELATKIKVKKGLRRLEQFNFDVMGNPSDSVLVRINIYDQDGDRNFPLTNLNTSKKEILYTIKKKRGNCEIDLDPFDIYVTDDFIISLELLKVYGTEKINLILAASDNSYTDSYRKYASQGAWERLEDVAMAYSLVTTYYSKKRPKSKKEAQERETGIAARNVSGFVFFAGRPQTNVKITNVSTGGEVATNESGRYLIEANPMDILVYEAPGMKELTIELLEKTTVNVNLERE